MSLKEKTRIDWCDYTWNAVWGCLHTCPYCYARATAKRYGKEICGRDDFVPTWIERNFQKPFPKAPSKIFVNSMSDPAFYEKEWLDRISEKIRTAPDHRFLWLTKSPQFYNRYTLPENCWLGTSWDGSSKGDTFEPAYKDRLHFLSIEPLLYEPEVKCVDWRGVKWAIIGAESGNRKGKVVPTLDWIKDIVTECRAHGIAVFMKKSLEGIWDGELIREYPE